MSRECLGALSFAVLCSCSQGKVQSFLSSSPAWNPWCAFGKIPLLQRELEQVGKALCKSHWSKLSATFMGSSKNSFSATLLSPLYPFSPCGVDEAWYVCTRLPVSMSFQSYPFWWAMLPLQDLFFGPPQVGGLPLTPSVHPQEPLGIFN